MGEKTGRAQIVVHQHRKVEEPGRGVLRGGLVRSLVGGCGGVVDAPIHIRGFVVPQAVE